MASQVEDVTNAQFPGHDENTLQQCKELSYAEKAKIRLNITGNKNAFHYNFDETRSVRMTIIPPPNSIEELHRGDTRPKPVPLAHIINCFKGGSLSRFGAGLQGLFSIMFNVYKVTFRTDAMAKEMVDTFINETTGRGNSDDEIFQFQISDFKDPIKTLTFYPIPVEFSEVQLRELIEDTLELGTVETCSWGRHRETPDWRNGFVHVRIRTKLQDIPDRVYINKRPVTILKDNQRLYRPCPLCNLRTHEIKFCPSFFHFEHFLLEKEKINSEKNDLLYAQQIAEQQKVDHLNELRMQQQKTIGADSEAADIFNMSANEIPAATAYRAEDKSTPRQSFSEEEDSDTEKQSLDLSSIFKHGTQTGDQTITSDIEDTDAEATAVRASLFDPANTTMSLDNRSTEGSEIVNLPNFMPGVSKPTTAPLQKQPFKGQKTKKDQVKKTVSEQKKNPPGGEKRKKSPTAQIIEKISKFPKFGREKDGPQTSNDDLPS